MAEPVRYHIIKNTSAFYRLTQSYMTEKLRAYDLGSGQQFFLDRIARNPGISMQELSQLGFFDNGTTTRAVQKLEEKGLVTVSTDERDRRIRRLTITPAGEPVVESMRALKRAWRTAVMEGLSEEEKETFSRVLTRLVENAAAYLEKSQERSEAE